MITRRSLFQRVFGGSLAALGLSTVKPAYPRWDSLGGLKRDLKRDLLDVVQCTIRELGPVDIERLCEGLPKLSKLMPVGFDSGSVPVGDIAYRHTTSPYFVFYHELRHPSGPSGFVKTLMTRRTGAINSILELIEETIEEPEDGSSLVTWRGNTFYEHVDWHIHRHDAIQVTVDLSWTVRKPSFNHHAHPQSVNPG